MFVINEDFSIYLTRGDIAFFQLSALKNETEMYKFQPGDVIRFKVFEKKACENVAFQKDFGIEHETDIVEILLEETETKIGEVISKPTDYWYEIELNPFTNPQTILGYDDDGPKVFKLFPEGKDIDDIPITPEDIPIVDEELDMTSTRPVQNQAIARAIVKLRAEVVEMLETSNAGKKYYLLWENQSPTEEFAKQDISLGEEVVAKYDEFLITYKQKTESLYDQYYTFLRKNHAIGDSDYITGTAGGYVSDEMLDYLAVDGIVTAIRRLAHTTKDAVSFLHATYFLGNGDISGNNSYLIPCKIYGVKHELIECRHKCSELENDLEFQTKEQVEAIVDSKVPTKVSQLENDKKYQTEQQVIDTIKNAGGFGGMQGDWNEGNETSLAHIKNRTHYTTQESVTVTWDGNTEGLEPVTAGQDTLYHVSDELLTNEQFYTMFGVMTYANDEGSTDYPQDFSKEMTSDVIAEMTQGGYITDDYIYYPGGLAFIRKDNCVTQQGVTFPKAGVYFSCRNIGDSYNVYVSKIVTKWEGKKLDEVYLPDTVATKEYVDNAQNFPEGGVAGQFLVSDGNGGATWLTVGIAEEEVF